MALRGNSAKDSKYLDRIKRATSVAMMPLHPRHHGVAMQAHHLISAEGMRLSRLGNKIEKFGYDINTLENLAFIPSTLQGACHLSVQPHRGNHTAPITDPDDYNDDDHPESYHVMVGRRVRALNLPLDRECTGTEDARVREVKNGLDRLSSEILTLIQRAPGRAPLTSVSASFQPGDRVGCGGVDSVRSHRGQPCANDRDHQGGKHSRNQRNEGIAISRTPYQLRTGR